jgi:glucuronoarabinoxylan endo-1,4-beta-xylanase
MHGRKASKLQKITATTVLSLCGLEAFAAGEGSDAVAVIDWSITHQTIDGFGASTAFLDTPLTDDQADMFFSATKGIGLTWLRLGLNSSGNLNGGFFPDVNKAAARGARIWAAPWTAPANWKDNNSETNGGHLCAMAGQISCTASHYADWATQLAAFPKILHDNTSPHIDLYALSIQNEPDYTASYESMLISNSEFVDFINVLGPKLAALNPKPLLIAGEFSNWANLSGMTTAITANSSALSNTAIFATHQYVPQNVSSQTLARPLWQTEMSSFEGFDPSIGNAVMVAKWIHSAIVVGNVTVWHYWWLFNPYNEDNEGLIGYPEDHYAMTKRFYAMGNYSKFVRPGWVRIDVSNVFSANLFVSAYKGPAGDFAIVMVNDSGGDLSLTSNLSGVIATSVVPWKTTATTLELDPSPAIAVSGNQLSVTVPYGVTTFVGKNDRIFASGFQ